jgi:hypothetical protein
VEEQQKKGQGGRQAITLLRRLLLLLLLVLILLVLVLVRVRLGGEEGRGHFGCRRRSRLEVLR